MKTRRCANKTCGKEFTRSTARKFYGKGPLFWRSFYCSTECREVSRRGRAWFEAGVASGLIVPWVDEGLPGEEN